MIDRVRSTVLQIVNKENRGYLSPSEFNRLAHMAQMDLFEQYFADFNDESVKMNNGMTDDQEGNMMERKLEVIESFSSSKTMPYNPTTLNHTLPGYGASQALPRVFRIQRVYNPVTGLDYDKISRREFTLIEGSTLLSPSTTRGYYIRNENGLRLYPSITSNNVIIDYIRHPNAPKWTYNVIGDNAIFDSTKEDYMDFELPPVDMPRIIVYILKYLGISIREADVAAAMASEESIDKQEKS